MSVDLSTLFRGTKLVWISAALVSNLVMGICVKAQTAVSNQSAHLSNLLPSLDVSPPHFLRIEPDGSKNTSDYFEQIMLATSNRIFKFNSMPIPIYIQPNQPDYLKACTKALENWQTRTNQMIRFTSVNSQPQARISIIWSHLGIPADNSSTEFGAHTITQWNLKKGGPFPGNTQRKGAVNPQIIEVNLDVIDPRDPEHRVALLQNLITHELGHALGIIGHSPERGDLMFHDTDEYSRISQRDLNTLHKIYSRNSDFSL